MRSVAYILLIALAANLSACAHKGGLKSPSQIEREDAKKAAKEAKKKAEEKSPPVPEGE